MGRLEDVRAELEQLEREIVSDIETTRGSPRIATSPPPQGHVSVQIFPPDTALGPWRIEVTVCQGSRPDN